MSYAFPIRACSQAQRQFKMALSAVDCGTDGLLVARRGLLTAGAEAGPYVGAEVLKFVRLGGSGLTVLRAYGGGLFEQWHASGSERAVTGHQRPCRPVSLSR